jgi:hypothetical protein
MFLVLAIVFFGVYTANVVMGAYANTPFVGGVGEMLFLLAASVAFVAGILKKEAADQQSHSDNE